ncbi:MAG TPA: ParB/RepB/Spo0J family partition protein [Patescibacteria group bacterium]|nr:ParB/RepB/Spo0J family partition protein [Patescibacteria group bacterium]
MKGGLGRGLASLIPNKLAAENQDLPGEIKNPVADDEERVKQVAVANIESNPLQPRENFDYGDLEDLVNSIKQYGIIQPLVVSPLPDGKYQLIAGERRLRAAQVMDLAKVPCLVRNARELEKLELALIENIQRTNLNPMEEARAYKKLIDDFSLTQEEVAVRVGKKRATIANALRLLELPEQIQQGLKEGKVSTGHAKAILAAESETERINLFNKILKFNLNVRAAESAVKKIKVKAHERVLVKDLELAEQEERLRNALNTKVTINKKGGGGTVTIDFYSGEELNEIIAKIVNGR